MADRPSDQPSLSSAEQDLAAGYVLGDLDAAEQAEFEAKLGQNQALQAEVSQLQTTLHRLPLGLETLMPPAFLGDRLLAAFTATELTATELTATEQDVTPDLAAPELLTPALVDRDRDLGSGEAPPVQAPRTRAWVKLMAAIAALAAIALGLDNLRLRNQLAMSEVELQRIAHSSTPDPLIPSLANILQRPKSRLVALQNADASLSGTLLFTPGQWQEVVVAFGNLPALPADQVYRMWLELANGEVLPCGEFKPDAEGQVLLRLTPPKTPPKGIKATGIFVTMDARQAPLQPTANRLISGTI